MPHVLGLHQHCLTWSGKTVGTIYSQFRLRVVKSPCQILKPTVFMSQERKKDLEVQKLFPVFLQQLRDASVLKAEPNLRNALQLLTAPPYSAHLLLEHTSSVSHAVFRQHWLHFRQQVNLGHTNSFSLTHPHRCRAPPRPSLLPLVPSPTTAWGPPSHPQSLQTKKIVFLSHSTEN